MMLLASEGYPRHYIKQILQRLGLLRTALRLCEAMKAMRLHRLDTHRTNQINSLVPDGLPIPPSKLMFLVGGDTSVSAFLEIGQTFAQTIRDVLAKHGAEIRNFQAILDFGCGCGRVIRHWKSLVPQVKVYGTDYNPTLIKWCRQNLLFAQFELNQFYPPLRYPDGYFDLVYAVSVFTHLPEDLQILWIDEITRVLKPGGYLLISTHGESYVSTLMPRERIAFASGQLVVRYESVAGTNLCATFHPEQYVRKTLARRLLTLDFIPRPLGHDLTLLQRPIQE